MKYVRRIVSLAAVLAFLLISSGAQAADKNNAPGYGMIERQHGVVDGDTKVNVRERADGDAALIGRLRPGESCVITGEEGDWWQIEFDGEEG